jgi:integrase
LISPEAQWAVEKLIERARSLGASSPLHYLFPSRLVRNHFDPTHPMSETGLRKAWDEVRVAAKLPSFRPYDTRHTAITRMAEEGIRIVVIMKRAGHVSARMSDHYTHISEQAERGGVQQSCCMLLPIPSSPCKASSYSTNAVFVAP